MSALIHEIPKDGERYDMTLDSIGKPPNNDDQPNVYREDDWVVRWIIDNGDFKGKRVSHVVHQTEFQSIFGEDLFLRDDLRKKFRISARVLVSKMYKVGQDYVMAVGEDEEWSKMIVTYTLVDIDQPQHDSQLEKIFARQQKSKFIR